MYCNCEAVREYIFQEKQMLIANETQKWQTSMNYHSCRKISRVSLIVLKTKLH